MGGKRAVVSSPTSLILAVLVLVGWHLPGQVAGGRVTVQVRQDGRPLSQAIVRADGKTALTNNAGEAAVRLPVGLDTILIMHIGFFPDTVRLVVRSELDTVLTVVLRSLPAELAPVVVIATRSERRMEEEPLRVEALTGEDITEKTQMRPGDLTQLLRELSGVRLQPTPATLGGARLRLQGLDGRYTLVVSDGLPLQGAEAPALGLAQIPPIDLRQVEVIKGAATALYGPAALAGVVDLISQRPGNEREVVFNQTSRSGTDGVLWLSKALTERWGYTLVAGAHRQREEDLNMDGWADLPGYTRVEIRPRLFWTGARGSTLYLTTGAVSEQRDGGTVAGASAPDGNPFRLGVDTRRADIGLVGTLPVGANATATLRASATEYWRQHRFGGLLQRARGHTVFGEATLVVPHGRAVWLVGAAVEQDGAHQEDIPGFDYRFTTPSLFVQSTVSPVAWLNGSVIGRCDAHSRFGTICSSRAAVLAHSGTRWSARLSAGTGFFGPTTLTGEVEDLDLTRVRPTTILAAEHAQTGSLDLTTKLGPLEINATLFASAVRNPVLLRPVPDSSGRVELRNAVSPARTQGAELFAFYNGEPITITAQYTFLHGNMGALDTAKQQPIPLDPRHSAGLDVAWEDEHGGARVGLEVFYTGRQSLEDDPYRTTTPSYTTVGLLVSWRLARATVYLNGENLTDVRQTRYDPLLLPAQGAGGRWTTDQWAPLEGRVVNAGVLLRF